MVDIMVCAECGIIVSESVSGRWVHVDELPEKTPLHDVAQVMTMEMFKEAYLERAARPESMTVAERQTLALERIAAVLERIATRLDNA